MNYEKVRTKLWVDTYLSISGDHKLRVTFANSAVNAFDEKFGIDDLDMEVSVDDIINIFRKSKSN